MSRRLLLVLMVSASMISTIPPVRAGEAPAPPLEWRGCRNGFECAALEVPVDYSAPDGEQLDVAVIRHPATSDEARIGSLVVNFGGPGDPGTETMRLAYSSFPAELRERFDLVSFDPRGTGRSRAIDCVDDATFERAWSQDVTPDDVSELPDYYSGEAFSIDLIGACIDRYGEWLAHVGTRNVARDLDRLREGLGDARLTYLGFSYGTVLGAIYAQEFPANVRAMTLDSAVNLSITTEEQQADNAEGFESALEEFLASCADDDECAYHSDGQPRRALFALRKEFEAGGSVETRDGRTIGVTELYVGMLEALYSRGFWDDLAEALRMADEDHDGSLLALLNDLYAGKRADGSYNNVQEAIGIILCADEATPRVSLDDFEERYFALRNEYRFFGPAFGGAPLGCDPRLPVSDADEQLGDVRSDDAPPLLIIGVTKDPATPYSGAVDLRRRLRGSRLLTLESTQHGGFQSGNACIDDAVNQYLLSLELPPKNQRCEV